MRKAAVGESHPRPRPHQRKPKADGKDRCIIGSATVSINPTSATAANPTAAGVKLCRRCKDAPASERIVPQGPAPIYCEPCRRRVRSTRGNVPKGYHKAYRSPPRESLSDSPYVLSACGYEMDRCKLTAAEAEAERAARVAIYRGQAEANQGRGGLDFAACARERARQLGLLVEANEQKRRA